MKRLLCIVGSMNAGGAETFLMKMFRSICKENYKMDFAVAVKEEGYYDKEILSLGGRIYHITPKSSGLIKNFNSIKHLVHDKHYEYVLRTSQHSLSALELLAAKFGGAKVRVFRSSNSNTTSGAGKDLLLHQICRFMPIKFANVRIAPSSEAAEFMFGKHYLLKGDAVLLHNGIDLNTYQFNWLKRAEYRKNLNLENRLVVGHIGRFNHQKNHVYLLNVFKIIKKINNNAVLMLIGKGELEKEIKNLTLTMNLSNSIIFAGVRSDIPQLLSAMDVFVFPSLYEGMPNTVIEAQATGLPCVISDTITREADITGLVKYLSLSDSYETWAKVAMAVANKPRKNTHDDFIKKHYDIESVTEDFIKLIFNDASNGSK